MLTREENELITRVGPGAPMGDVLRRYWMPALLSEELSGPDSAPVRVKLLGEELVAFRDTSGQVGLIEEYCPHRLASMFLGRNEEHGLRCVYHGWKIDAHGDCVDMPNEPAASRFKEKIHVTAYPVIEKAGVVWAYLGPEDLKPALPDMEWMRAPDEHRLVSVTHEYANYVQCVEGGIDTCHSSFAHNNDLSDKADLTNSATAPRLEVTKTDFGLQYASIRDINPDQDYVRLYTFVMPFHQIRSQQVVRRGGAGSRPLAPTIAGHIWVPMDDENTLVFNWHCAADPENPPSREHMIASEASAGRGPGGEGRIRHQTRANDWQIDREVQRTKTFTGVKGLNTQDLALQESMGPIVPRWREHLGTTDLAIIAYRQILLDSIKAVQAGNQPPGTDPASYRNLRASDMVISKNVAWRDVAATELVARH